MSSQEMHGKEEGPRYSQIARENNKRKRLHKVRRNQIDTLVPLCLDSVKTDFRSCLRKLAEKRELKPFRKQGNVTRLQQVIIKF